MIPSKMARVVGLERIPYAFDSKSSIQISSFSFHVGCVDSGFAGRGGAVNGAGLRHQLPNKCVFLGDLRSVLGTPVLEYNVLYFAISKRTESHSVGESASPIL